MSPKLGVMDNALAVRKKKLREAMRQVRTKAALANPQASVVLRDVFLSHLLLPPRAVIAFYLAQGDELNVAPLVQALAEKGHVLCLPVVVQKEAPLVFRAYGAGDSLQKGSWGIPEPLRDAPVVHPDVLLVPLLAFNRAGYRLGQGGGYYDRTLVSLRGIKQIMAVGIAYDTQEVPDLPVGPHDALLDAVVTESAFIVPHP